MLAGELSASRPGLEPCQLFLQRLWDESHVGFLDHRKTRAGLVRHRERVHVENLQQLADARVPERIGADARGNSRCTPRLFVDRLGGCANLPGPDVPAPGLFAVFGE